MGGRGLNSWLRRRPWFCLVGARPAVRWRTGLSTLEAPLPSPFAQAKIMAPIGLRTRCLWVGAPSLLGPSARRLASRAPALERRSLCLGSRQSLPGANLRIVCPDHPVLLLS